MADETQEKDKNKIDDYVLLSVIATGKLTQIWEVAHETSGQKLAMKLLQPQAMEDPEEKELLKQECKVAQLLEHPNLLRSHGVVIRKTECYVLMDLFKAPNVKQFIHSDMQGAQSRFRQLVEQSCLGLAHMHDKGWVHKDIKPDNILLSRSAEVRIIDFSLAVKKASGLSKLFGGSKGAAIRGTRSYMAPEIIRKEPAVPATDIYSLGITFYEVLTGTVPFKGDSPQDLLAKHISAKPAPPSFYNKNVSPEMDRIILKMLAKKPTDRYQSCQEILSEFRTVQPFIEEVVEGAAKTSETEKPTGVALQEMLTTRRDSRVDALKQEMLRADPELAKKYASDKAAKDALEKQQFEERTKRAERDAAARKAAKGGKPATAAAPKPAAPQPAPQQMPMPQMMPGMMYPAMGQGGYMPMPGQMPPGYMPMPHQQMPGQFPGQFPGQMPSGYPLPGQQFPGQQFPGQQMPGQMPPGYGMPGMMPQMPGGYPQMPGYPQVPGQPMPGQMPPGMMPGGGYPMPPGMPQQPMPGQPMPQQPAQPQRPAAASPATPAARPPVRPQSPAPASRPQPKPPQPAKPDESLDFMTELPDFE